MGWIILIIIIVIVVGFITFYNRLIRFIEAARNNEKQIDIQLDRRYKVFQSLIEVVKKYMNYEQTTLKDVVALRNQAQKAKDSGDAKARQKAEDAISSIAGGLNVVFEQYPDLKASQNAMQLQEEIVNTENKLAFELFHRLISYVNKCQTLKTLEVYHILIHSNVFICCITIRL